MIRVQYARRHHVEVGFKGLKDESFDMNDDILGNDLQVVIPEEEKQSEDKDTSLNANDSFISDPKKIKRNQILNYNDQ